MTIDFLKNFIDPLSKASSIEIDLSVNLLIDNAKYDEIGRGRVKAKIARQLKYVELTKDQKQKILEIIEQRLLTGNFSQQFKDELKLGLYIDPQFMYKISLEGIKSEKKYVCKYSLWLEKRASENLKRE